MTYNMVEDPIKRAANKNMRYKESKQHITNKKSTQITKQPQQETCGQQEKPAGASAIHPVQIIKW
jgi:hypothetical protein